MRFNLYSLAATAFLLTIHPTGVSAIHLEARDFSHDGVSSLSQSDVGIHGHTTGDSNSSSETESQSEEIQMGNIGGGTNSGGPGGPISIIDTSKKIEMGKTGCF